MIKVKDDAMMAFMLCYLQFAFIVASLTGIDGNTAFYAGGVSFLLLGFFLLIYRVGSGGTVNIRYLLLCCVLAAPLILMPVEKHNIYIRLFTLQLLVLIYLFSEFKLSVSTFSKCINIAYLLYFALSVINWLDIVSLVPHGSENSFLIKLGGMTVETLFGVGGSTADIDSYSGLILIWNFFVNKKGRYRFLMIAVSAFAMLMTFRMTPLVALLVAFLSYLVVFNRFLALLAVLVPALVFAAVLLLLHFEPSASVPFITPSMDWYTLMWKATHARSSIWIGQIYYYLTEFNLSDFVLGPLDERMTVEFIDGDGRVHSESYNPHSTYLAMLFRSTVIFALFYLLFLVAVARRSRKSTFPVIFFISIVAYTNAGILGVQNPTYLLVLLYVLIGLPRDKFRARPDSTPD